MKTKIVHLFFLILTGIIISWREWTNSVTVVEEVGIIEWHSVQEVGSSTESFMVLLLFLAGAISIFVMNGWRQPAPKLSSPNSV